MVLSAVRVLQLKWLPEHYNPKSLIRKPMSFNGIPLDIDIKSFPRRPSEGPEFPLRLALNEMGSLLVSESL